MRIVSRHRSSVFRGGVEQRPLVRKRQDRFGIGFRVGDDPVKAGSIVEGTSQPEDTCQQENYDTNPFDSAYSQYAAGRLTAVQYYGPNPLFPNSPPNPAPYSNASAACGTTYTEMYNYSQPGGKIGKRVRITRWLQYTNGTSAQSANTSTDLNAAFAYDNEGRVTSQTWPSFGPVESQTAGRR